MRNVTSEEVYSENPCLEPKDIADAVIYILGTPEHVQVNATAIIITRAGFYVFSGPLDTWMHSGKT
jgi:NADP-dependent 3-hydroxy acid dehydrogenase YdfG